MAAASRLELTVTHGSAERSAYLFETTPIALGRGSASGHRGGRGVFGDRELGRGSGGRDEGDRRRGTTVDAGAGLVIMALCRRRLLRRGGARRAGVVAVRRGVRPRGRAAAQGRLNRLAPQRV